MQGLAWHRLSNAQQGNQDEAVDTEADPIAVRDEFPCRGCQVRLTKRSLEPYQETVHDPLLGRTIQPVKRVPCSSST